MDEVQDVYWKLQSCPLVTELNTTFDEFVWASDIVRSRAFAIARRDGNTLYPSTMALLLLAMYIAATSMLHHASHRAAEQLLLH